MAEIKKVITLIAKIMVEMLLLDMEDRARSEYSTSSNRYSGERWISVSIYLPMVFKTVEPVTSFFKSMNENTNQQKTSKDDVESKKWSFGTDIFL